LLNVNSHGNGYAHGTSFSPNGSFADLEGEEMTVLLTLSMETPQSMCILCASSGLSIGGEAGTAWPTTDSKERQNDYLE